MEGEGGGYLEHDATDVVDALGDGVAGARDGDGALGRVGQHLRGDDDRSAGDLADLLDLGAALADQRAALRRRHDQPQRDRRPRNARPRQRTAHFLSAKQNKTTSINNDVHCIQVQTDQYQVSKNKKIKGLQMAGFDSSRPTQWNARKPSREPLGPPLKSP